MNGILFVGDAALGVPPIKTAQNQTRGTPRAAFPTLTLIMK